MTARTKTGGRKAGTPNKVTGNLRQALSLALEGEIEALPETLEALEPDKRVDAVIRLCKYLLPPIAPIAPRHADQEDLCPENYIKGIENDDKISSLLSF